MAATIRGGCGVRFDRCPCLLETEWKCDARDVAELGRRICFQGGGIAVSVADDGGALGRTRLAKVVAFLVARPKSSLFCDLGGAKGGHFIATPIVRIARMSLDPTTLDRVLREQFVQYLPQV
jgi:hypothetical protein